MRYGLKIVDEASYKKLPPRTKRLFDADMERIKINPRRPGGSIIIEVAGRDMWRVIVADGDVIAHYRIINRLVEVHVVMIMSLP